MKLSLDLFDYNLPKSLISQRPPQKSRLMIVNRKNKKIKHNYFNNLDKILTKPCLIVFNTTKVQPVRLYVEKSTGGKVELFILKFNQAKQQITAWVKPGLKGHNQLVLPQAKVKLNLIRQDGKEHIFRASQGRLSYKLLSAYGHTPLPPYINPQAPEPILRKWYQSIFAKKGFSVAAPTASLHFKPDLVNRLKKQHHHIAYIRLDVGIGTFEPVRQQEVTNHKMHSETFSLSPKTAELLNQAKTNQIPIVAVGTTVARCLESSYEAESNTFTPIKRAKTNLFIYPPYKLDSFDTLITNFHLPKSTLLMLVAAMVSWPNTADIFVDFRSSLIGQAYQEAIKRKYGFFSFGDAMMIK